MTEKKIIAGVKKLTWKHWIDRPYGVFIVSVGFPGISKKYFNKVGLSGYGFGYNADLYQYPNLYQSIELSKKNLEAFKKYLKSHKIKNLTILLDKVHHRNKKKITLLIKSKKPYRDKLAVFRELVRLYFPFLWLVAPFEEYFQKITPEIVTPYVRGDPQEFIGKISLSKKKNIYALMQKELLSGVPVEKVHKKYSWLRPRDGFTDFYTIQELAEMKKHLKKTKKAERVIIPKGLKEFASELQELTFLRTDRTDKFYEFLGWGRSLLIRVAESIGITFKELEDYDAGSIISGNPKRFNKGFSYAFFNGEYIIQDEVIIPDLFLKVEEKIKGKIAYSGISKGIAKIVRHPSEIGKVNAGDILVAQMTLPSFIPAMQKASAFVTDEGGITCHAAIIAREMGKPCIIATRTATKTIKDGDLVEVDAEKGIVRIIKKAE